MTTTSQRLRQLADEADNVGKYLSAKDIKALRQAADELQEWVTCAAVVAAARTPKDLRDYVDALLVKQNELQQQLTATENHVKEKEYRIERLHEQLTAAQSRIAELEKDKARLDWLQQQTSDDCDSGWIAYPSTTGRGYRLAESSMGETKDVRTAIDKARAEKGTMR